MFEQLKYIATLAIAGALCFSSPLAKGEKSSEPTESESGFGLTYAEAIEVCKPRGEEEYLRRLRCPDGKAPSFSRAGSVGQRNRPPDTKAQLEALDQMMSRRQLKPDEVDYHMLDLYVVECSNKRYDLYLDMYHCPEP